MRIAFVTSHAFKSSTSGGRHAWELPKALSRYAKVTLVCFANTRSRERISDSLVEEVLPAFRSLRPLFDLNNPLPLSLRSFLKILQENDVIHINNFGTLPASIATVYCHFAGKPIFASYHGGRGLTFARPFPFLGKWVTGYLFVCRYMFNMFAKYGRDCRAMYVGVDTVRFRPLNIEKVKGKVLFVGRLDPIKGVEYLIDAVRDLDATLYLAGPPENEGYLEVLKARDGGSKAIFLGRQLDDALVQHYNSALVTVHPSAYINKWWSQFPQSDYTPANIIESMACGTPVIGTDVAGLPELIQDGKTGFIVPSAQPEALRKRIAYLLANPRIAADMGRRAREVVLDRFTWEAVARRCLEAYLTIQQGRC